MAKVFNFNNDYQYGWQKAELSSPHYNDMDDNRPRLYLWAAGGTGMRVVNSMIMLCASGLINDIEVIPVLFDIDDNCSSLQYAIKELELYYKIYEESESGDSSRLFFGCHIRPIMVRRKNTSILSINNSFKFDVQWKDNSRQKPIVDEQPYWSSKPGAMELIESLFGKQNVIGDGSAQTTGSKSSSEIRLQLGDLGEKEVFRNMLEMIDPLRDKIIIVGSAFGTTGTAFVYELARLLNNSSSIKRTPKALVLMEPFFQIVGSNHTEDLPDEIMKKRAQESMRFFNDCNLYKKLNVTYLIGAGIGFKLGRTTEGGETQKNPNCIHELIGALAIVDFCKRTEFGNEPVILNYVIPKSSTNSINIADLARTPNESSAMSFLTRFALAMKYVKNNKEGKVPAKVKDFSSMFYLWISEMERVSKNSFISFDLEKPELHTIIKGKKFTEENFIYSITHSGKSKPLFTIDDFIIGMTRVKKSSKENKLDFFLRQLEAGSDALMDYITI